MSKKKLSEIEKDFFWNLATNNTQNLINIFRKIDDKNGLFAYCNKHNIEEHFHRFLEKNIENLKHDDTFSKFSELVKKKKIQTLMNVGSGLKLCEEFQKNKINYVTLKGLSYVDIIDIDSRLFRDLDILVDIKDIQKSVEIAQKNGFKFKNNKIFTKELITNSLDKYCLPQMYNKNNVVLEIHYRIVSNEYTQCKLSSDILAEKKLISAYGHQFFTPPNEYKFLHLAYHSISKGNFDVGISSIFDLFLFKRKGMINLDKINRLAQNYNFSTDIDIFNLVIRDSENKLNNLDGKKYLEIVKNLFLQPAVNKRITGYHLASGLFAKLSYLIKYLFVNKEILKRDFNFTNPIILYLLTPFRWLRQMSIDSFSLKNFFLNYNDESKRAKLILSLKNKDIYRKMR